MAPLDPDQSITETLNRAAQHTPLRTLAVSGRPEILSATESGMRTGRRTPERATESIGIRWVLVALSRLVDTLRSW